MVSKNQAKAAGEASCRFENELCKAHNEISLDKVPLNATTIQTQALRAKQKDAKRAISAWKSTEQDGTTTPKAQSNAGATSNGANAGQSKASSSGSSAIGTKGASANPSAAGIAGTKGAAARGSI